MKVSFSTQRSISKISSGKTQVQNCKDIFSKGNKDIFIKNNISFKGKEYSEEDIKTARKYINRKDDDWKEVLFQETYAYKKKHEKIDWEIPAHNGCSGGTANLNNPADRAILDLFTFALTEIPVHIAYSGFKKDSREYVDYINLIRIDLIDAKLKEDAATVKAQQDMAKREIKYIDGMNKAKDDEIYPKLLNKIQARKEGKNVEIPNCIMFSNPSESINNELINWSMEQANANSSTVDLFAEDFDFVEFLEEAEKNYQSTGDWNVVYVKNMDKAINPSEVEDYTIAGMKGIMCATADNYHTTLLFSATNPEELDDVAIESNRVTKINTSNVKSMDEMETEDIKRNLEDSGYVENSPLNAINSLLVLANKSTAGQYELSFDSSKEDFDKTIKYLEQILLKNQELKKYIETLKNAINNVWYIV